MPLKEQCVCDFSIGRWSCTCGYGAQEQLLDRIWRTTSMPEAREIIAALGIPVNTPLPHPSDVNETGRAAQRGGERHPIYSAYVWRFMTASGELTPAWRWCWLPEKGN